MTAHDLWFPKSVGSQAHVTQLLAMRVLDAGSSDGETVNGYRSRAIQFDEKRRLI